MQMKIANLGLKIQGTAIEPLIHQLYRELSLKQLIFKPVCFLADEWFVPVGIPAIGIPFYLAHNRLRRIERKIILDVEGGTKKTFMQLLRHETGHAFCYAYQLNKRRKWIKLFGSPLKDYPDTYRPRPYSRSHVTHLDNWYAQSHPDEDFAETFAVWLTPRSNWKSQYRHWKALEKLEYVDALMRTLANKAPKNNPVIRPKYYSGLSIKLKTYYTRKKKQFESDFPDFYDNDLKTLFTQTPENKSKCEKASKYLRQIQQSLSQSTAFWAKERKYTITDLMRELTSRCAELKLYVREEMPDRDIQISGYITSLVLNYKFTGVFKRSK